MTRLSRKSLAAREEGKFGGLSVSLLRCQRSKNVKTLLTKSVIKLHEILWKIELFLSASSGHSNQSISSLFIREKEIKVVVRSATSDSQALLRVSSALVVDMASSVARVLLARAHPGPGGLLASNRLLLLQASRQPNSQAGMVYPAVARYRL